MPFPCSFYTPPACLPCRLCVLHVKHHPLPLPSDTCLYFFLGQTDTLGRTCPPHRLPFSAIAPLPAPPPWWALDRAAFWRLPRGTFLPPHYRLTTCAALLSPSARHATPTMCYGAATRCYTLQACAPTSLRPCAQHMICLAPMRGTPGWRGGPRCLLFLPLALRRSGPRGLLRLPPPVPPPLGRAVACLPLCCLSQPGYISLHDTYTLPQTHACVLPASSSCASQRVCTTTFLPPRLSLYYAATFCRAAR